MSKRIKWVVGILAALLGMLGASLFCLFLMLEEPDVIFSEGDYYSVDLDTILGDLSQGKKDVFLPQIENLIEDQNREFREWTPGDHFLIAEAAHEMMWGETLEGWQISVEYFEVECKYFSSGPHISRIDFLRIEWSGVRRTKFTSTVYIDLLYNDISAFREVARSPMMGGRQKGVDPRILAVSGQRVLEIVEANGGAEFRRTSGDECEVTVALSPSIVTFDGNWKVLYDSLDGSLIFWVAPDSGELVEIESDLP